MTLKHVSARALCLGNVAKTLYMYMCLPLCLPLSSETADNISVLMCVILYTLKMMNVHAMYQCTWKLLL